MNGHAYLLMYKDKLLVGVDCYGKIYKGPLSFRDPVTDLHGVYFFSEPVAKEYVKQNPEWIMKKLNG